MARQPGDSDFTNVNATGVVKVASTQVVGAQGSTPAFVNADLANTVTRLNAVITALETHGLIA